MKKLIFPVLLAVALLLASCGETETKESQPAESEVNSASEQETQTESVEDTASSYVTVLDVSLKPEFRLFLSEAGEVVDLWGMNAMGENVTDQICLKDGDHYLGLRTTLDAILRVSDEAGYLKTDAGARLTVKESAASSEEQKAFEALFATAVTEYAKAHDVQITLGEVIPEESTVIETGVCAVCMGAGSVTCDVCLGSIEISCDVCGGNPDAMAACASCNGSGTKACLNCADGSVECTFCHGTGQS